MAFPFSDDDANLWLDEFVSTKEREKIKKRLAIGSLPVDSEELLQEFEAAGRSRLKELEKERKPLVEKISKRRLEPEAAFFALEDFSRKYPGQQPVPSQAQPLEMPEPGVFGPMLGRTVPINIDTTREIPKPIHQKAMDSLLPETINGRPILKNRDGSVSTELSITVEDERLNQGRPTNIPSIWDGVRLSDQEAILRAIESGQKFPAFNTVDDAVISAKERSNNLGKMVPQGQNNIPLPTDPVRPLDQIIADSLGEALSGEYNVAGALKETGYEVAKGFPSAAKHMRTGLESVERLAGVPEAEVTLPDPVTAFLAEKGQRGIEAIEKRQAASPDIQKYRKSLQEGRESFPTKVLGQLGPTLTAMGLSMIPGAGPALSTGYFYGINAEDVEQRALEGGAAPEDAKKVAGALAPVISLLEMTGLGAITKKVPVAGKFAKTLLDYAEATLTEGSTEVLQDVVAKIGAEWATKKPKENAEQFARRMTGQIPKLFEGGWETFKVAAAIGGGVKGVHHGLQRLTDKKAGTGPTAAEIEAERMAKRVPGELPVKAGKPFLIKKPKIATPEMTREEFEAKYPLEDKKADKTKIDVSQKIPLPTESTYKKPVEPGIAEFESTQLGQSLSVRAKMENGEIDLQSVENEYGVTPTLSREEFEALKQEAAERLAPKPPKAEAPKKKPAGEPRTDTLATFIRKEGGLDYQAEAMKGELDRVGKREGVHGIVRKNGTGRTVDQMLERAREEGYFGDEASPADFLQALEDDLSGKPHYSTAKEFTKKDIPEPGAIPEKKAMVPAGALDLKVGDSFKIGGEKYEAKRYDSEGNLVLEDGVTMAVDPFDRIPEPDQGSMKRASSPPVVEKGPKVVEPAAEVAPGSTKTEGKVSQPTPEFTLKPQAAPKEKAKAPEQLDLMKPKLKVGEKPIVAGMPEKEREEFFKPLEDETKQQKMPESTAVKKEEVRQGKIGDKLSAGEIVLTSSGRKTTPFPKIDLEGNRKAINSVKRIDKWLHENALAEAESRNDEFNALQFKNENPNKLPQASKDSMEEYLFGEQPKVLPPFTKPIVSKQGQKLPEPTETAKKKQPWEMMALEYTRSRVPGAFVASDNMKAQHKVEVKAAIGRGETVPENVLKDYPDLVKKETPSPEAVAFKPTGKKTPPLPEETRKPEKKKIEDFGEKIGGARKDYATTLSDAKSLDIKSVPFSKAWPEPNYQKMIEDGADPYIVGFIRSARDVVPKKPMSRYGRKVKMEKYAKEVETLRQFAEEVLGGKISKDKLIGKVPPALRDAIELYEAVGHEKSLKGVKVGFHKWVQWKKDGEETEKEAWQVTQDKKASLLGNWPRVLGEGKTKEEAIADFKKRISELKNQPATKTTKFLIYTRTNTQKLREGRSVDFEHVWIGKKVGRDYIDLKEFDSVQDARKFKKENQAALEDLLEKAKYIPDVRRGKNQPRIGEDHRNGKDVTPDMFTDAFGFRGVEFGNWVNATGERQEALNSAFDALYDLSRVLGIPTQAISLNGDLGLAFGARGKGGKKAAAHYEPDRVVINLTRKQGHGSLAHEWWHALDNYFSRSRGRKGEYLTELPVKYGEEDTTRKEVIDAFGDVVQSLKKTGIVGRSKKLDQKRSTPYWSTTREVSARAFETYVISELKEKGFVNDYLANIVDEGGFTQDMFENMGDPDFSAEGFYPYLTEKEAQPVNKAFKKLFDTLETRETEKGTALFSPARTPGFFSKLTRTIESKMPNAASPQQIAGIIKGAGVKVDEIKWSGIQDFLEAKKGKVTKREVLDYLAQNEVKVEEVEKGKERATSAFYSEDERWGDTAEYDSIEDAVDSAMQAWDMTEEDAVDFVNETNEASRTTKDDTKFSDYQIPGGENYRELLLTLPSTKRRLTEAESRERTALGLKGKLTKDEEARYIALNAIEIAPKTDFKSPHFDEPNVLAHVRFNDRTDADGKKVLFIEEVQSDWGQSLRKSLPLRNLSEPQSIRELTKDVLGAEMASAISSKVVEDGMLASLHYDQVRKAVVSNLSVNVVNNLKGMEISAHKLLSNPSVVFKKISINHRASVAKGIISSVRKVHADLRAKLLNGLSAGSDVDLLPALKASDLTAREIVSVLAPESIYHVGLPNLAGGLDVAEARTEKTSSPSSITREDPKSRFAARTDFLKVAIPAIRRAKSGGLGPGGLDSKRSTTTIANLLDWHNEIIAKTSSSRQVDYGTGQAIPEMPFERNWMELSLKRLLRYAAENGYDKLAWTTGEQQAERYDLSKQVAEIHHRPKGDGKYEIVAIAKGSRAKVLDAVYPEKELEGVVGKEIAEKIIDRAGSGGAVVRVEKDYNTAINYWFPVYKDGTRASEAMFGPSKEEALNKAQKARSEFNILRGEDLKVGGEGMKGFYDKMIPSFLNKYGKKWGARVGEMSIDVSGGKALNTAKYDNDLYPDGVATVPSIDITPAMKKSVMTEGQPLFKQAEGRSNVTVEQWQSIIKDLQRIIAPGGKVKLTPELRADLSQNQKAAQAWGLGKDGSIRLAGQHRIVTLNNGEVSSLIELSMRDMNADTPFHEAWHSVESLLLSENEQAIMDKAFPDKGGVSGKERAADAFAEWVAGKKTQPSAIKRIFQKIRDFFVKLKNAVKGLGFESAEGLFGKAYSGELKKRVGKSQGNVSRSTTTMYSPSKNKPKIVYDNLPKGVDGYFDDESNRILVSKKLSPERAAEIIKHEMEHAKQHTDGKLPTSKYVAPNKSIKLFMEYFSDPSEVSARAEEKGETVTDIWDEVFRLREQSMSGKETELKPLRAERIVPIVDQKTVPETEFRTLREHNDWQTRRLTGQLQKTDPKPIKVKTEALRVYFKDRGNGIIAESMLKDAGIKAFSSAPFSVDIMRTDENLTRLERLLKRSKSLQIEERMPGEVQFSPADKAEIKDIENTPSPYERHKDYWFGNKDVAILKNSNEAADLQGAIKRSVGEKRYAEKSKDVDRAIQIYLDLKRNPSHLQEFYDGLTDEQKRIVDLSQDLTPEQKRIAARIDASYKATGLNALKMGVIRNVLDNYAARTWRTPKKVKRHGTEALRKFGTKTRHAKARTFDTILEGWSTGRELLIEGATNNLKTLKDEIARTIEDKKLLSVLKETKDENNQPLISDQQLEGYERIEHPNFTVWKWRKNINEEEARGRNFFTTEDGDVFERMPVYAPKKMAENLNNILGTSKLKGRGIETLTKYNAVFKSWILQTSLFHHLAFMRSYLLGTRHKTLKEYNVRQAYRDGMKAIREMQPEIEFLVHNGLTLQSMQDWEEAIMRQESTIFEDMMDKTKTSKAIKEKIKTLRQAQADFLFKSFGAGLKAKAALIEYRNALKEHPDMDPRERAKMVANLVNDDFGGLHLGRIGRNPTRQHIFRLLALAPDWCCPADTRAMTKTGWKYHNELKVGVDEILAFNPKTRKYEWSSLQDKYVNENYVGPMVEVKNRNRAVVMTPAHTCYVYNVTTKRYDIVKASELQTNHVIPRCAEYDAPEEATYSDRFIQLVGWIVTDGYVKKSQQKMADGAFRVYRYGRIVQSKPLMVDVLKGMGLSFSVDRCNSNHDKFVANHTRYVFNIPNDDFIKMEKIGVSDGLNWEFLSKLTKPQRQLLYDTMMLGDGTGQNRFCGKEKEVFYMTMLQTIMGLPTTFYQQEKNCWRTRHIKSKHIYCWGHHNNTHEVEYNGTIWCPSVDTGFWLAERKGLVFITGNTESNVRSMVKMFGAGTKAERRLYRQFWASIVSKGIAATVVASLLLSLWDDDDAIERFKKAWEAGHLKWLDIDITPIYKILGGDTEARKYFSILGHFKDPMKFALHPVVSAKHKGSVFMKGFFEAFEGSNWQGKRFTTIDELMGVDDKGFYLTTTSAHKAGEPRGGKNAGQLVRWGAGRALEPAQVPSFVLSQVKGWQPVQIQNFLAWYTGEMEGFEAIGNSLGLGIRTTYPDPDQTREEIMFAKQARRIREIGGRYDYLKKEGKPGEAEAFRSKNIKEVGSLRSFENTNKRIARLKRQRTKIEKSTRISKEEKDRAIEIKDQKILEAKIRFIEAYDKPKQSDPLPIPSKNFAKQPPLPDAINPPRKNPPKGLQALPF